MVRRPAFAIYSTIGDVAFYLTCIKDFYNFTLLTKNKAKIKNLILILFYN